MPTLLMRYAPLASVAALVACATATTAERPSGRAAEPQPSDTIHYTISFPNAAHHEAEVTLALANVPPGPVEVRMSRSSPGRYALHEFAKNVYNVRATGTAGQPLAVTQPDPYGWTVSGHDGTVTFRYTLFADRVDGTYSAIDRTHAHLNMPATFAWARGHEARPIRIAFGRVTPDWRVATQLAPTAADTVFTAPNLYYFLDSPTEVSAHETWTWQVDGQEIRFALHHAGTRAEADSFVERVKLVVREQQAMWGGLPRFDYGTYTFIADYLPWANGDGMEHRNSTVLTSGGSIARNGGALLGTVSHEFFHAWNVERLRPRSLEPFDFERANMSDALWFAEGFTSYYDDLFIRRAGLLTLEEYGRALSGTVDFVLNAPGRRYHSPIEMSRQAPFVDAATALDPNNRANTFISYYTYGAALGLALDLAIRQRFPGRSLDDVLRRLWRTHGAPERPYELADLRAALAETVGDAGWANEWWRRHIEGSEAPPFAELLAGAGYLLRPVNPGRAWLGPVGLEARDSALVVTSSVTLNSPLYAAGVERGDRIVSLDGQAMASVEALEAWLTEQRPGRQVPIVYASRDGERRATLTLSEDFRVEIVPGAATPLREAWLGQ